MRANTGETKCNQWLHWEFPYKIRSLLPGSVYLSQVVMIVAPYPFYWTMTMEPPGAHGSAAVPEKGAPKPTESQPQWMTRTAIVLLRQIHPQPRFFFAALKHSSAMSCSRGALIEPNMGRTWKNNQDPCCTRQPKSFHHLKCIKHMFRLAKLPRCFSPGLHAWTWIGAFGPSAKGKIVWFIARSSSSNDMVTQICRQSNQQPSMTCGRYLSPHIRSVICPSISQSPHVC